jgi:N-methylhydantoinase B/oxoprolinase/acetone carboxylase alpha subunit
VSAPDPAALAVLIARLTGVAEEMGAVLRRGAFSPNIKERADCSAALFTADGTLLVQAEHIPVHLGSMPASVAAAIGVAGPAPAPGEQWIVNDPFAGGTHLNDVTLVAPCHTADGRLVGWAANRAHHADLGGAAPGSLPADATEIQQEGFRVPPMRFTPEVRELLVASSRTPDERRGDIDAQVGANVVGVARLAELADQPLDEVIAYGERRMRAAVAALPDGTWSATDVLDSTGAGPDQRAPAVVAVTVTVAGERITFDFTGTDPQSRGNVNAVEAVTVSAAVFALRTAIDPGVPANGGGLRVITVVAPPGSLVAARPPAAVGAGNVEVSQRVADVCLAALAGAAPDRVGAASQGTMNNLLIGGDGWVYYETIAGGQGARPGTAGQSAPTNTSQPDPRSSGGVPGQSAIHTGMTNTRNTPIEALERSFPMRVRRYKIRSGSGGAGAARGGDGIERDLEMLEDVTVSLITERRDSQPWGLAGGAPGASGENWLLRGGDEEAAESLPDKCTLRLAAGDVLRMLTPGGGGWGAEA